MTKPQSPLTAIERPRCPRCQNRMPLVAAAARDLDGCDKWTFKCEKCGESRTVTAPDPMKSNLAGWFAGELKPPT